MKAEKKNFSEKAVGTISGTPPNGYSSGNDSNFKGMAVEKTTLRAVAAEWLASRRGLVKASTFANYTAMLERHILPELGELALEEVTLSQLEEFFQKKLCCGRLDGQGGLSAKTAADLRGVLKLVLQYAREHGCPEAESRLPSLPRPVQKTPTLSAEEQKALEEVLFLSPQPVALGVLLALYGGLRIGEVCALKWEDINFKSRSLSVSKTLLRIRNTDPDAATKTKLVEDTPKTQCSCRTIPLPDFLILHLWNHRRRGGTYLLTGTPAPMEPRVCLAQYKALLHLNLL